MLIVVLDNNLEVFMAERSFVAEIENLRKGEGDVFTGEGILAITKALLECGVVDCLCRT